MIQSRIDSITDNALESGAALDFDNIQPIQLSSTFGLSANIQNNFDNAALQLNGMAP